MPAQEALVAILLEMVHLYGRAPHDYVHLVESVLFGCEIGKKGC